jgi:hypothetical protein
MDKDEELKLIDLVVKEGNWMDDHYSKKIEKDGELIEYTVKLINDELVLSSVVSRSKDDLYGNRKLNDHISINNLDDLRRKYTIPLLDQDRLNTNTDDYLGGWVRLNKYNKSTLTKISDIINSKSPNINSISGSRIVSKSGNKINIVSGSVIIDIHPDGSSEIVSGNKIIKTDKNNKVRVTDSRGTIYEQF